MAKDLENTMVDNNVYLLTQISPETTNSLIIQLTRWVDALPVENKNTNTKIYSPYEPIPNTIPVLNVWINCCGGNSFQTKSILNMFNIATAHGTIIKTYNTSRASSSASMLAVSGTHGYRYMAEDAYNMIHYGNTRIEISHPEEAEFNMKDFQTHLSNMYNLYQSNTHLTAEELEKYFKTEGAGQLYSQECLEKGLCDWIITNDGRFVNSISELKKQSSR